MTREEIIEAIIDGMLKLGLSSIDEVWALGSKNPKSVLQEPVGSAPDTEADQTYS